MTNCLVLILVPFIFAGMEDLEKNVQMKVYIDPKLLERLKYLHKKEGPMNYIRKKRKPFSVFIGGILGEYAYRRIELINGMEHLEDFENDLDF